MRPTPPMEVSLSLPSPSRSLALSPCEYLCMGVAVCESRGLVVLCIGVGKKQTQLTNMHTQAAFPGLGGRRNSLPSVQGDLAATVRPPLGELKPPSRPGSRRNSLSNTGAPMPGALDLSR